MVNIQLIYGEIGDGLLLFYQHYTTLTILPFWTDPNRSEPGRRGMLPGGRQGPASITSGPTGVTRGARRWVFSCTERSESDHAQANLRGRHHRCKVCHLVKIIYCIIIIYIYSWKWSIKDVRWNGARELWGSQVGGNLTWVAQRLGPRLPEISRCPSLPGWSPWDSAKRALTPWPFWTYAGIRFYLSSFIHVYPSIHPFIHGSNHPFVVDLTTQSWSDSQGGWLTKDGEWWPGESFPNTNDLIFSLLNYFEFSRIYGFIMRVLSQIPGR